MRSIYGRGQYSTPSPPHSITFLVKFLWSDPGFIKPKKEYMPVMARDRDEAVAIFNKFLGTRFGYPILDVSVYEYE